jgi:hypothetical protein
MAQTTIIINQSDVETIQPTSTCNEFAREVEGIRIGFKFHISSFTAPRIYRKQLRMYRRMAAWAERHEALVNTAMAAQVVAFMAYVFLYY